jgi:hypothetical protein
LSSQDLQGNDDAVRVADGSEHHAHSPLAEDGLQDIGTEPFARQEFAVAFH